MRSTRFGGINSPTPHVEANACNIREGSIDCGITTLGWCNTPACQKLGTVNAFLTVLILVGIVYGAAEKFLSISVQQAALEHDYDPDVVDWLLVTNGIVQGIFAVLIAYWGNRIHKISWLSGMIILHSVVCFLVVIPTLTHNSDTQVTIDVHRVDLLCTNRTSEQLIEEFPHSLTTLILLFILQVGTSYAFIAFYTLGLTYLDDNAAEHNAPALIGAALAARFWGNQWGHGLSLAVKETTLGWWFGWTIISPALLILAIIVGLFPVRLLSTIVRQAADTIIETATNSSQLSLSPSKLLADISFTKSICRLLRNKLLLFNILATVFVETAVVNYFFHEQNYLQSRFFLPSDNSNLLNNEWTSRIITKFIQPPIAALSVLVAGLIIAKANPSARKLVAWNIITAFLLCCLFVSYVFIECNNSRIAGAYNGKLVKPYCSRSCLCDEDIRFTPVCPENSVLTYYSPCHAGCSTDYIINGQRVFGNCTCGVDSELAADDIHATDGACGYMDCQKYWIIFQVLTVFGAAILATRLVGKIIISIRCVLRQDKALALALELSVTGLIVYIPGKIVYELIADYTCQFWSADNATCFLHNSSTFGNSLNVISAILVLIGLLIEILVFALIKDLPLYGNDTDDRPMVQLQHFTISRDNADGVVQQREPLLQHDPTTTQAAPLIQSIQNTQQQFGATPASPLSTETDSSNERRSPAFETNSNNSPNNNNNDNPNVVKYTQLARLPPNHIEELNFRLQTLNESAEIEYAQVITSPLPAFGSDINPSVGDISDKESELNIRQLESTISSLSGVNSSTIGSPLSERNQSHAQSRVGRETDF